VYEKDAEAEAKDVEKPKEFPKVELGDRVKVFGKEYIVAGNYKRMFLIQTGSGLYWCDKSLWGDSTTSENVTVISRRADHA
jgi:hypothetical protein